MPKKNANASADVPMNSPDLQDKLMSMQMMDQQAKQLQKYISSFDEQLVGIRGLIDAISELGKVKSGETIYAPLANGIFVKAKIESASSLLVNVGNDVVVEKTMEDAIKLLENQEVEIKKYREDALEQLKSVTEQLSGI